MTIDEPPLNIGTKYIIITTIILSLINPVFASEALDNIIEPNAKVTWNSERLKSVYLFISKDFAPEITIKNLESYGNGQCVPYARYKTGIQLTGWAGSLLDRAEDEGYLVSDIPAKGGMVITNESNGHVAVVEDVDDKIITISEQNYKGLYIVSSRKLSINDPIIKGYIHNPKN